MNQDRPPASGTVLLIDVPADVEHLRAVRMVARRALPALDPDEASLFYGAVSEIVTNAIDAHRRAGVAKPIRIEIRARPGLAVIVRDHGPGFEEATVQPHGRGHGLVIARAVCPGLQIDSSPDGTSVVIPFPEPTT